MNEEQVRDQIGNERRIWLELRVADRVCNADRKHVRRNDLDEAAPCEMPASSALAFRASWRERRDTK